MNEKDAILKYVLSDPIKFADLFNGTLFMGNQVLNPNDLTDLSIESNIIIQDKEGKKKATQRYRDIIKKVAFDTEFVILACENQSEVHYAMPVRKMMYDALTYTEQVQNIAKMNKLNKNHSTKSEFLSKYTKNDKIIPIVTLVLYYGKSEWDASTDLYGMMKLSVKQEMFKEFVSNYKMHMLNVNNIVNLEHYNSSLREIFGMLKYSSTKTQMEEYVVSNKERFANIDEITYTAISILLDNKKYLKDIKNEVKQSEGGYNMCLAFEQMREEDIQIGERKGEELNKINLIKKKLQKGYTSTTIADHLELDINYIENIIELLNKYPDSTSKQIVEQILGVLSHKKYT